jgi:3-deoxy-D-manno-octulosonic-acid transferase
MPRSLLTSTVFALYRAAGCLAAPLITRLMKKRRARGKEDTTRFGERFGHAGAPRPDGNLVWIHGSSVGEAVSALPLIERLLSERPDLWILVTTGTVTSAGIMGDRLPEGVIHQFLPIDSLPAVRRFFDHWRPQAGLVIESEFWPNLLLEARSRGIPLHLINGRMSPKSFKNWRRTGPVFRRLLESFSSVQAQSPEDQAHFQALGRTDCTSPGNLKFAAPPLDADPAIVREFRPLLEHRPRWLLYSSHPGEERMTAEAHREIATHHPGLLTMIAPRHPERGPGLAKELRGMGLNVALRSAGDPITPDTEIYLADTLGELGVWFRLNDVVTIGGTLIPKGGQNPIEAAKLDCAILCGPYTGNFLRIVGDMIKAGALRRIEETPPSAHGLASAVSALLNDPAARAELSRSAGTYAETQSEVLARIMALLTPALNRLGRNESQTHPD